VERDNSNLKDNWGGRFVRVRGAAKVGCHLFFGMLAMTADRLIDLFCGVRQAENSGGCENQALAGTQNRGFSGEECLGNMKTQC